MKIKTKITLSFIVSTAFLSIVFSILIYVFSSNYRQEQFTSRLKDKALTTARLLLDVDEVDEVLMAIIQNADQTVLFREKVMIFDNNFNKIYESRKDDDFILKPDFVEIVSKNSYSNYSENGFEIVGVKYIEKGTEFISVAIAYDKFGYQKLANLSRILLSGVIVSILLLFTLGRIFAHNSLKPISSVVEQVESITVNSLNVKVKGGSNKDEIAHLAETFNGLLERLDGSFKAQKSFVSSASHELRNPFAAIVGQIEVALLNLRNEEEYRAVLLSIKDDIVKLISLTNRLLLLAQTNEDLPIAHFKESNIDEILWKSREELIRKNSTYNVNISFAKLPDDEDIFKYDVSEQLLEVAFINLMENACKFSKNNKVEVSIDFNDEFVIVSFTDNGCGIEESELNNIFEPFYRVNSTADIQGHGIGLSLVKNIINIHNASIKVESKLGEWTTFSCIFPK